MPIDYTVQPVETRGLSIAGGAADPGSDPSQLSPSVSRMHNTLGYRLISDLIGGTEAMRQARTRWLPREEGEEWKAYTIRLERSFLYPGFTNTRDKLRAHPFGKPVTLTEPDSVPEELVSIEKAADRHGNDLTTVLDAVLADAIDRGQSHVLVDYMPTNGQQTYKDEASGKVRPYFVHVREKDLIGFSTLQLANGMVVLHQVRWRECVTEKVGVFGQQEVEQIRVYTAPEMDDEGNPFEGSLGTWQVFRQVEKGKWSETNKGVHTYPGVPFFTFATNATGFMVAESPIQDLGFKNLEHYQSASDQRNILKYARVPMLFLAGLSPEEMQKRTEIGPARAIRSSEKDAKAGWIEHGGKAIEAGRQDLLDLRAEMEVLGLAPLVAKTSEQTATGVAVNEGRSLAPIERWVRDLNSFALSLYKAASTWVGKDDEFETAVDNGFGVRVYSDFVLPTSQSGLEQLVALATSNKLPARVLYLELKRRGILDESIDVDELVTEMKEDAPAPPMPDSVTGLFGDSADPQEEDPQGSRFNKPAPKFGQYGSRFPRG